MIQIVLDWPDRMLSPNARVHRLARANAIHFAREVAWAKTQPFKGWKPERVNLAIIFKPPDRRRRDLDNCYSMCKGYQDGVFQALGLDDSIIEMVELRFGKPTEGGAVVFTVIETN